VKIRRSQLTWEMPEEWIKFLERISGEKKERTVDPSEALSVTAGTNYVSVVRLSEKIANTNYDPAVHPPPLGHLQRQILRTLKISPGRKRSRILYT